MKKTKILETKNLSDKDAEIAAAIQNLYDICEKYNVTMFARAILNEKKYVGAYSLSETTQEKQKKQFRFLIDCIGHFINDTTNGQLALVRIKD